MGFPLNSDRQIEIKPPSLTREDKNGTGNTKMCEKIF